MSKAKFAGFAQAGEGFQHSSACKRMVTGCVIAAAGLGVCSALTGIAWLGWGSAAAALLAGFLVWRFVPAAPSAGDFAARLITVQEEERKRLSRDLHDGVGQVITALKMELARVQGSAEDAVRLERARSHADEALTSIRNVSRLLRPTLLDDLGLEAALQWHLEDFGRRTGIRTVLSFELPVEAILADAVNTCIYRTVQESLNNCEKHSGASLARVTVTQSDEGISVTIADNGRGLKSASPGEHHHGIRGMGERAHILGGEIRLESEMGKGTSVNLSLPW
jgi:signal transduction histidine kinase